MPGMILPKGEFALVAHPTDWFKRPYILMAGRWYHFNSRRGLSGAGITEHTVREAIQNEGYVPVFFGLKIERPAQEPSTVTFSYTNTPSRTPTLDEMNSDAWSSLGDTIEATQASFTEAQRAFNDIGGAVNTNYDRQMDAYQRWVAQRDQGRRGGRIMTGYVADGVDRGTQVHRNVEQIINQMTINTRSYAEPQIIPNPHGDDTTRRYPTSEQVTTRRRT